MLGLHSDTARRTCGALYTLTLGANRDDDRSDRTTVEPGFYTQTFDWCTGALYALIELAHLRRTRPLPYGCQYEYSVGPRCQTGRSESTARYAWRLSHMSV